jgi:hypothetical protein
VVTNDIRARESGVNSDRLDRVCSQAVSVNPSVHLIEEDKLTQLIDEAGVRGVPMEPI